MLGGVGTHLPGGGVLSDLCPVLSCSFLSRAPLDFSFPSCMPIFGFVPVPVLIVSLSVNYVPPVCVCLIISFGVCL